VINVPLEKLSEADRRYVKQQASRVVSSGSPALAEGAASGSSPSASPPLLHDTGPVNLLTQIRPERDQVRGTWRMEGASLITPKDQAATLVIPSAVPLEYVLTVVAERILGNDSLNLGLIVGGRQTMLTLDGWGSKASGLNTIEGRTASDNVTTFRSPVFLPGKPSTIVCTVRLAGVQVSCNGQVVMNWTGNPDQLDLDRRFWTNLPRDKLFLGTWSSSFRISKLELMPLAE